MKIKQAGSWPNAKAKPCRAMGISISWMGVLAEEVLSEVNIEGQVLTNE